MSTIAPSSPSIVTDNNERVQSEQSKFVQHLATYPALTALAGLIASFPVPKIFASNAIPLLQAIHERSKPVVEPVAETAYPYFRTLDDAGDAALDRIDKRFPSLQRTKPHEVYEEAHNYLGTIKDNARTAYNAKVAEPIFHAADAARNQYSSIYNNSVGRGISPFNDQLESAIDHFLPSETAAVKDDGETGSQIKRTYSLAKTAAERAAPKLAEVYNHKLDEKSGGSENPGYIIKLLAVLATGKFLSVESYNHVLSYFGSTEKLQAAVEDVKLKAQEFEKEAAKVAN